MELYFLACGAMHRRMIFEQRLNTIPMVLPFKDKDGTEKIQPIYPMLQEIKLYRYVFPKDHLDTVVKTLEFQPGLIKNYNEFNLRATALRKIMKAKKIPEPKADVEPYMIDKENIALIPIGIKEDPVREFPDGRTHEAI